MKGYKKIDDASYRLTFSAGRGGKGLVSFVSLIRSTPGNADGGNGGRGGDVYLKLDENLRGLSSVHLPSHSGINGGVGAKRNCHGAKGKDIYILVPLGTRAYVEHDKEEIVLGTITSENKLLLIAQGGKGGLGNFSDHRCEEANRIEGRPGATADVILRHIIPSDVIILGNVNAGKSLFFNKMIKQDQRSPSLAYPCTTLQPVLGAIKLHAFYKPLIILDTPSREVAPLRIPYLIQGSKVLLVVCRDAEHQDITHLLEDIKALASPDQIIYVILNAAPEESTSFAWPEDYRVYACDLSEPTLSLDSITHRIYEDLYGITLPTITEENTPRKIQ